MPDGGQLIFETANCKMGENYCNTHTGAKPGDYVLLSISDTGHGMNEEVRSRIFEPFFTTKKLGEGTGLGLALSYGIVKNHGGYITCYSEVGAGTTFKIYFPAAQNPSGSGRQGHSAAQEAPAPGGKETILIVEDEAAIRKLAARLLGSVGYRVLEASDGLDALEVYERYRDEISLVVLDIMMPRLDGLKCLAGLKRINPGVKALIASGYSPTISAHNAEEAGAQGFLSKPYDREAMLRQVRQVLDRVA
jgi:CheY-like chemotaxis protein